MYAASTCHKTCLLLLKRLLLISKNLNHNKNADWDYTCMLCMPCKIVFCHAT